MRDAQTEVCGRCLTKGQPVGELTVKALLAEQALRRFEHGVYRFCPNGDCAVVYFDAAGHAFTTNDVRVPVWQKNPVGTRTLCYCFDENEVSMRAEVKQTGRSAAVERVRAHIAADRCACDVRNPRGACCLGDLIQAVNRMTEHDVSHR